MPVQVPVPEPEVIDTPTMENPNKFVPKLKLKTLHEQKVELGKRAYRDVVEDEIMDEKVMKMLNKTSDFVYADDSEYYQFYERKKLNEDSWRDLYKSDDKAYKALKSKFLLTEEKKKNEIILERGLEFKPIESDALGKTNQLQANEINLRDSNTNNMGMNANFKLNINNKKDKEDAALERHVSFRPQNIFRKPRKIGSVITPTTLHRSMAVRATTPSARKS